MTLNSLATYHLARPYKAKLFKSCWQNYDIWFFYTYEVFGWN